MTNEPTIPGPGTGAKLGDFCETATATDLEILFRVCQAEGELGIVTGEPGVGKTTAAQHYAARNDFAFHITMSPAASMLVPCLARIGEAIGTYPSGSGACAWSDAIRSRIRSEPEAQLLLIDEAQHLSDAAVEEVRSILDATDVGVVFIGGREIRERWSGRRWAQLTSRVYQSIDIDAPIAADIDAICTAVGIEGKRARDKLARVARMPGGLRVVRKVLGVASVIAGEGKPITAASIDAALKDREESR
nr:AAA family ATPase [uncultured Rhodopila sp.]